MPQPSNVMPITVPAKAGIWANCAGNSKSCSATPTTRINAKVS
jgi:hypothetical protein